MSLFKVREWWAITSGFEEFHDNGSLCVANIDNSPSGHDKILVGSFQGLLRVYSPHPPAFSPDHVLLERELGTPVLQVAAGRFIQGSEALHLAVLHPRELAVHTLTSADTDQGPQYSLSLVYQHQLERTACNMTYGPFGGAGGQDYMVVQSMDGQLSFFQQDTPAFSCFLPDFLLPGPLRYVPCTNALLTVNSDHSLLAFRYQTLSLAAGQDSAGQRGGKKIVADWSVNLGEHAVDISVSSEPGSPTHIIVLGERSVFCFKDSGALQFMKKLDFAPSCVYAYGGEVQYLLASHTGQLLVFRGPTLVWAAKLHHSPAAITVANFQELKGVIVTLDELGHMTCGYLGTDPTSFTATSSRSRELNYEELDREMKELQYKIRESQKEGVAMDTGDAALEIRTEVETTARTLEVSVTGMEGEGEEEGEGRQKCVEVKLYLSCTKNAVKDVTVSITSPLPLSTHPSHIHLDKIVCSTPPSPHTITVVCTPTLLPSSRHITISASYSTLSGLPRAEESCVALPLSLFCHPSTPDKAEYKVTLDTNHPAISLHTLFPDLLPSGDSAGPLHAMGFRLLAGPVVTIVASKSSERYRLQSDSLPAIALLMDELLERLKHHHADMDPQFQASYSGPLPLEKYFEIIDQRYKLRVNIEQCRELLSRHAQQFRAIQKRLLTRFKDKTPVGLAHLDTLLDGTYMQLMALGEKNEAFQAELLECSHQLSCATQLIITLLKLSVQMDGEDYAVLRASLSPIVTADGEQGWEEQTDAAITHLLRTTLAKSAREQSVMVNTMELPSDNRKLKRHIALLCDRISKGGSLRGQGSSQATRSLQEGGGAVGVASSGPRRGEGQAKPEVISQLPINHSVEKTRLPTLPEHGSEDVEGVAYQQTDV